MDMDTLTQTDTPTQKKHSLIASDRVKERRFAD